MHSDLDSRVASQTSTAGPPATALLQTSLEPSPAVTNSPDSSCRLPTTNANSPTNATVPGALVNDTPVETEQRKGIIMVTLGPPNSQPFPPAPSPRRPRSESFLPVTVATEDSFARQSLVFEDLGKGTSDNLAPLDSPPPEPTGRSLSDFTACAPSKVRHSSSPTEVGNKSGSSSPLREPRNSLQRSSIMDLLSAESQEILGSIRPGRSSGLESTVGPSAWGDMKPGRTHRSVSSAMPSSPSALLWNRAVVAARRSVQPRALSPLKVPSNSESPLARWSTQPLGDLPGRPAPADSIATSPGAAMTEFLKANNPSPSGSCNSIGDPPQLLSRENVESEVPKTGQDSVAISTDTGLGEDQLATNTKSPAPSPPPMKGRPRSRTTSAEPVVQDSCQSPNSLHTTRSFFCNRVLPEVITTKSPNMAATGTTTSPGSSAAGSPGTAGSPPRLGRQWPSFLRLSVPECPSLEPSVHELKPGGMSQHARTMVAESLLVINMNSAQKKLFSSGSVVVSEVRFDFLDAKRRPMGKVHQIKVATQDVRQATGDIMCTRSYLETVGIRFSMACDIKKSQLLHFLFEATAYGPEFPTENPVGGHSPQHSLTELSNAGEMPSRVPTRTHSHGTSWDSPDTVYRMGTAVPKSAGNTPRTKSPGPALFSAEPDVPKAVRFYQKTVQVPGHVVARARR